MSRSHSDLAVTTRRKVALVEAEMLTEGYRLGTSHTYRSLEEQGRLWAKGRTSPGKIVTKTKRGWHNLRRNRAPAARAIDWFFQPSKDFCNRNGKQWTPWDKKWPWALLRMVATKHGLRLTLKWDKGHFIDSQGETFSQAWAKRS